MATSSAHLFEKAFRFTPRYPGKPRKSEAKRIIAGGRSRCTICHPRPPRHVILNPSAEPGLSEAEGLRKNSVKDPGQGASPPQMFRRRGWLNMTLLEGQPLLAVCPVI